MEVWRAWSPNMYLCRLRRGLKLARAAERQPFHDVEASLRIHTHRVRRGEERGVRLIARFVGLAIDSFPVAEMRYYFVARVQNCHHAPEVRDVEMVVVLIKAARQAEIALQFAFEIQIEIEHLEPAIGAVRDVNFRLVTQRADPHAVADVEL